MNTDQGGQNQPKKQLAYVYVMLSLWIFKILCITNKKKLSQYLLVTVNISSNELILINLLLIQQVLFKVFLKV